MSTAPEPRGDPQEMDVRPVVGAPPSNRAVWVFGGGLLLGGVLLFQALEARRTSVTAPRISAPADSAFAVSGAPTLVIPPDVNAGPAFPSGPQAASPMPTPDAVTAPIVPSRSRSSGPAVSSAAGPAYQPGPGFTQAFPGYGAGQPPGQLGQGPSSQNQASRTDPLERPSPAAAESKDRVKASRFLNPATTVPKGTVVQAVLESALDSTRGGFVRALVSRDIASFDGSRVLIQRGSRILGEYKSDVSLGQKRILIQWQRLTRPDGVIIDLDSPSADPLGRAGTQGKVDTHFFQRFAGAFLQSSLNIGVQLAARAAANDTIVLALPGSIQQGMGVQTLQPDKIAPTVTVKQGTSVSVFVAKDLDFTDTDK